MNATRLAIPDVILVTPDRYDDARGYFTEVWQSARYAAAGVNATFVQDNQSGSHAGVLRGLHYQVVRPQGKLVRVVSGEIFDVAVDLRRNSPTFGRWVGAHLSAANRGQIYVPPGFAHGFLVTSEAAEVAYKCTDYHHPQHERTLLWNDPEVGVDWPLAPGAEPVLSAKDLAGRRLADAETYP